MADSSLDSAGSVDRSLIAPGLKAEYARLMPNDTPSVTDGSAIGVAFAPQTLATWDVGGEAERTTSIPASAVFITPREGLNWYRWSDVSESVEFWLDDSFLGELSRAAGGPGAIALDYRERIVDDPITVSIAASMRAMLVNPTSRDPMRLDWLTTRLAMHVLERYHGLRLPLPARVKTLDDVALRRVTEYVAAHLDRPLSIVGLAAIANQSPFHFAKTFKATTGAPPHEFVTARRMERAIVLLRQSRLSAHEVARRVGYEHMSHFRAQFRRAWGISLADARGAARTR